MKDKQAVARAALQEIKSHLVIGIGTGSTVNCLIELLNEVSTPDFFVSSSIETTELLRQKGFEVRDHNDVGSLDLYIDGADQVLPSLSAIKGRGGAQTLEKVLAYDAKEFVGMVTKDKVVEHFSAPIPVEVLSRSRSSVARKIIATNEGTFSFQPELRLNGNGSMYMTNSGNVIFDVHHNKSIKDPEDLERRLSCVPGLIESGLFAARTFDRVYVADGGAVTIMSGINKT